MFRPRYDPFGSVVRMVGADPDFQSVRLLRKQFASQTVLLRRFDPALPPIIGRHGPVHLHASGEARFHRLPRESGGIFQGGHGSPGDEHEDIYASVARRCEHKNRPPRHRHINKPLTPGRWHVAIAVPTDRPRSAMRDDYIKEAQKIISDPNILINVVSRRVKQLKRGSRPLVESLEKLAPEDIALREVIEGKINHELSEV